MIASFFSGLVSVSMSIRFYIVPQMRNNQFTLINMHFSNFCFCFLFPQAASCVTLSLSVASSPLSSLSFRLPSDGSRASGAIYFSWLLLPRNTDGFGSPHPGICWIIALLCLTISLFLYLCKCWSPCLLLIILCGQPSSRSPGWTGGHVACRAGTTWRCLILHSRLLDPHTLDML